MRVQALSHVHFALPSHNVRFVLRRVNWLSHRLLGDGMGRTTPSARLSFEDLLGRMRTEYKDALLSVPRRAAFDRLVEAWSAEMGAISYAESISLMDLLLLTGAVDNRRRSEEIALRLRELEERTERLARVN